MQLQTPSHRQQSILILGGTNFMGKTLLDFINTSKPHTKIYCINRGKIYWNNEARKSNSYEHYVADRKDHKDLYNMVLYLCQKVGINQNNKWKAVVDFSGFRWRDIQSVSKAIGKNAQKYIYISSDSIYNNQKNISSSLVHQQRQQDFDIDAQRLKQKTSSKIQDRYGYNKLKCQVYLKRRCQVPTYCLRLPDVIGPYDNTDRFWTTLQWIKRSMEHPIPLSGEDQRRKLGFVYSRDVCRFIYQLVYEHQMNVDQQKRQNQQDKKNKKYISPFFQSLNMGFRQNPTLVQFFQIIGQKMNIQPRYFAVKGSSNNCYPSTQFGYINIDKLLQKYKFQPTPIDQAIEQTVSFFNEKAPKYDKQRSQMMRMLNKKIKRQDD